MEMQLQNANKQKENFKIQLEEAREEMRKNKEIYSLLQKEAFELQKQADSSKEEIMIKTRQVEKLENANKDLVSKVEDLKQQLSKQRMSTELYANQSKAVETEMNLSQTKLSDLDTSLQATKTERDDLQRELFAVSSKLETVEEANMKNLERVSQLEAENSRLRDNINGLESEVFAQGRRLSQLEPTYTHAKEEIEVLTSQLEETSMKISQLEANYETVARERDELKEELVLSERRIGETKILLQKTEDASNEVEQKMVVMKSKLVKYEGKIESASKQKSNMKDELEEERLKVTRLKIDLANAQRRCDESQRKADLTKKEFGNKDKTIDELKASVTTFELKTESIFGEMSKLQAQLEIAEEEKKELQEQTLDAQKRVRDAVADNRRVSEENEKLSLEIQSFYKRLSELQASYNACEHEKHDFQHQTMALLQKVTKLEAELDEAINQRSACELKVQEFAATFSAVSQDAASLKCRLLEEQRVTDDFRKEIAEKGVLTKQLQEKLDALKVDFEASLEELKTAREMRESSEKENKNVQNQLIIKQEDYTRAQSLYETTLKRKEQLETELNVAKKRMANMESNLKKSVVADKTRELNNERSKSTELAKELASYKSKVYSLESLSALTKNEIQSVLDELEETENKMSILKQELETKVLDKEEREQKLSILEKRNSELEQEILNCRQIKEKAEEEIHIMRTRIAKYESQIETIQNQRSQLKEQLEVANAKLICDKEQIMRLESKVMEEKKNNETINKAIIRKDQLVEELQVNVKSSEAELERAKGELMSFKVTNEGLRAEKSEYEERLASYREKLEKREEEVFALRESVMALEQEMSTTKLKNANLGAQLSNLQHDKEDYKNELKSSQGNVIKMKKELKVVQNQVQEINRTCESLRMEVQVKENALEKTREDKVALETKMLALVQDFDSLKLNCELSQSRAKELEDSLDEANVSISKLELSSFRKENEELEKSWDAKLSESEALHKQSEDRERSLRQKLDDQKSKIKKLEAEKKTTQQENLEHSYENGILQRRLQECELSIEKYDQEKKDLKDEIISLHGKLTDFEVRYDYESREKESFRRQLEDALQRITSSREAFLENDKQRIEQRLGADATKKEMDDKELLIDQLKASKLYLEESIETLKHTLVASREDCERTKLEKGRLQQEILTMTSSNTEYETRIQKIASDRDRIQLEYQASLGKVSSLEQQIIEHNREKEAVHGKMEEWKSNLLMYQESHVAADKHIADLEGMVDALKTDAIKKDGEIKDLQTRNSHLEREADTFKIRAHRLEAEYKELAEQNRNLDTHNKSLLRLKTDEKSLTSLQEKAQDLEKEVLTQKRKVVELEANNRATFEKQMELQDDLVAARAEASNWESKHNMAQVQKNEMEHEMLALQREFTPLKDEHRHSVFQLESAQKEMQEARNKILKLEMEINKADNLRIQLEQQVLEYKSTLTIKDEELLSLQRKLQESRLLLEHKGLSTGEKEIPTESLIKENQNLEKELFMLRQELNSTQGLLTAATRERDDANKEVFTLRRNMVEMQANLNASQQQIQELQNSVGIWQRKMTTSEEGQQKAIIEHVTLRSRLEEANKNAVYSKEEFFETQRELFRLQALVENYKKEVEKNDSLMKEQSTRIRVLEDELRSLKLRIACESDKYESINNEVAKLKSHLEEKDRCISVTEDNVKKLLQENSKLRSELSDSQSLELRQKQNLNDSKYRADFLHEELLSLRQKISYLEAQTSAKENELQESRKELLAVKSTNFGFKSKYESLQRQKRELQTELSIAKAGQGVVHARDETEAGICTSFADRTLTEAAMGDSHSFLIMKNEEQAQEILKLDKKVLDLQSKIAAESSQKEKLECEVLWRTRRIEDLEGGILKDNKQDTDAYSLQINIASLEQELIASKETISRLQNYRDSLEKKIKATEEKLQSAEQKASQMESAYLTSRDRCDTQHNKFLEAQRRLSVIHVSSYNDSLNLRSLQVEFQGQIGEEEQLKRLIDDARKKNDDLRNELTRIERERIKSEARLRENTGRHSVTATLEIDTDAFKTEIERYKDDNHRLFNEKEDLSTQLHKLQLQITAWETTYSDIKQERDDLRFQLSCLQKSYSQLRGVSDSMTQDTHSFSINDGESLIPGKRNEVEIQQLKEERDKLSGEVASYKLLLLSHKEKIDLLLLEKVKLNDKIEAFERTVFTLEQANKTLLADKNRLEQRMHTVMHKSSTADLHEFSREEESGKMFELRIELEKMTKERDQLQHLLDLARSRDAYDRCMQPERAHDQKIAEKDSVIDELRKDTTTLQLEVSRLRQEQSLSQYENGNLRMKYMEILSERDNLQKQCIEYRLKSEKNTSFDNESHFHGYWKELSEKNVTIGNLRTETFKLQAEIDSTRKELLEKTFLSERNNIEVKSLREETNSLRNTLANNVRENGTLKLKLDDICKERDFLFKNKCSLQYDLSVSQRKMSEAIMTGNSKKAEQELTLVQSKFAKLENDYKVVKQENDKMKLEMKLKIKTEVWSKQESIYELERKMRKLKAENEYHQKIMEEKNENLRELRMQILSWQKEAEKLEKELYVSQEAYEKCDRQLREIFNSEQELLTVEDLRSLVSASPVLSTRSVPMCESSVTGERLIGDNSLSLSSIRYSFSRK